jgi:SpoVK/Ycf46/Vps4 family AAA+-type ATPase
MLADESIEPGYGVGQSKQRQWIVAKQSTLAATLSFFHAAMTRGRKRVRVFGGEDYFLPAASEHAYSWNDVLLDEARQSLVRQDFEHFLERREWFAARRVPWRRGYLFHGPPGNGKTSAVRAMASHPGLSVFSINFAKKEVDDFVVSEMFEAAADYAPGLIVLEDFDRVFVPASDGHKPECSFSHILNCLDGLSSQDGTLVVATANQPEKLDDAILRRPGRFDRVVQFPLPDAPLRLRYLSRLCERAGDLTPIVRKTERFSFAQLREVWILACQNACVRDGDVTLPDLEAALAQVKREQNSTPRGRFGFLPLHESKSENIPVPLALQP